MDWDAVLNQIATDLKLAGIRHVYQDSGAEASTSLMPVASLYDAEMPPTEATMSHVWYHQHTLTIQAWHEGRREALTLLSALRGLWNGNSSEARARLNALRLLGCVNLFPQDAGAVGPKPETMTGPAKGKYLIKLDFTAWAREQV